MRHLILVCIAFAGCNQPNSTITIQPSVSTKTVDPKYQAYKTGVLKFIEEARSVNKAAELLPDHMTFGKRRSQLEEVYTRVPDCPQNNELAASYQSSCKEMLLSMYLNQQLLELLTKFSGTMKPEETRKAHDQLQYHVGIVKLRLDELETAVSSDNKPKEIPIDVARMK